MLRVPPEHDADRDFELGVDGFRYPDLHSPDRLKALHERFLVELAAANAALSSAFAAYREQPASLGGPAESELLIAVARQVSAFVARLFRIEAARDMHSTVAANEAVLFRFKKDFVKWRSAKRKDAPEADADFAAREASLVRRGYDVVDELNFARRLMARVDREAELRAAGADEAARAELIAELDQCDAYLAQRLARHDRRGWVTLQLPEPVDHQRLVQLRRPDPALPTLLDGPVETRRRRDGFKLTDPRMTRREVQSQIDYCIYCHDREKDSCSSGLCDKSGALKKNPLGIPLAGCPLDERISEMHVLAREGDPLGALAMVCIDNPMLPGTGHRICNDCMKSCIYQKQEPVNIPQIETRVLTDCLELPYGFEIYGLLTRWNPLNVRRPYALPYNGKNVLVVGLGPAGYTLAQHLLNEGFGVVGIDGLKIEPLAHEVTGDVQRPPRPVRDVRELYTELDERVLAGFGGVSEYGITVRWDKNFLTVVHLTLARRGKFRFYGGVRFGGTLELDDIWELGVSHVAIAAGAGKPTLVEMENNLIRGIRKASDFLMALQLTGAFKRATLANLQVRLPAIVIGGGLTAIDTATELLAYYVVQVEKTLERYELVAAELGEERVLATYDEEERGVLLEFLAHGREVRAERARAQEVSEAPDFGPLLARWGGVAIAYRKSLADSPAYRLNHEEVIKCLEEGVRFIERLNPKAALADSYGALRGMVFESPHGPVELPARTCCVAAGTSPNVIYEKEHPGTFALDSRRQFFQAHRLDDGKLVPVDDGSGFFTSYGKDGRYVTFYGDNHPRYAGSVVKAMASARDGFRQLAELFADELQDLDRGPGAQSGRERAWSMLCGQLEDELEPRVALVKRLTPTIVEVVIRAPAAARKFQPGQFYRLQNYETASALVEDTRLAMEGIALTGAWVDKDRGLLSLIVLEMGSSSRLCASLRPGERVVVMGPTGTPTETPPGETVVLCGGGLGNAVLFSIARAFRAHGSKVVYFAGYKKAEDLFKQDEIEQGTDVVIWSVDAGDTIAPRRPQDRTFRGNIVQAMMAYATGSLGEAPVQLAEARRIIAIGSDRMMAAVAQARHGVLAPHLHQEHVGIGSINSPMQCMMKEICAQCLQRHVDPQTGRPFWVFSCFNQDQKLDEVDWKNLNARLRQNTVAEKLSNLWLDRLIRKQPRLIQV
jgi:NADPH-dependent glutamate synthase beta subunit-like oxidoreductase/NAD(P)H-flavin reductase